MGLGLDFWPRMGINMNFFEDLFAKGYDEILVTFRNKNNIQTVSILCTVRYEGKEYSQSIILHMDEYNALRDGALEFKLKNGVPLVKDLIPFYKDDD